MPINQARGPFSKSSSCEEGDGDGRASSFDALNCDIPAVSCCDALHNGQSKSRASGFPCSAGIHPIKALLHMRKVGFWNANASVLHDESRLGHRYVHIPGFRCMAIGIADQITECPVHQLAINM